MGCAILKSLDKALTRPGRFDVGGRPMCVSKHRN